MLVVVVVVVVVGLSRCLLFQTLMEAAHLKVSNFILSSSPISSLKSFRDSTYFFQPTNIHFNG